MQLKPVQKNGINGIKFLLEESRLMLVGVVVALVWANYFPISYVHFAHEAHFVVNDLLMCFFFALAAKEIWESLLPGGDLHSPRKAATPLFATLGGMVGPASLYLLGCWLFREPTLTRGWAIPCATDIPFSYMVARLVFGSSQPRHPAVTFLLLLAVADDAGGLAILAVFYPTGHVDLSLFAILVGGAVVVGVVLTRVLRVRSFWWYLVFPGTLSWCGFYFGGLHPALALVPIVPTMPHARTDLGVFDEREEFRSDTLSQFEHWWKTPVELFLFAFALVNAGMVITGGFEVVTGLVLGGLLIGKLVGIVTFTGLALLVGFRLSNGMRFRDVVVVGMAAGIGFTVALFVATVAFPPGAVLDGAKMGALLSFGAAPLALLFGILLGSRSFFGERHERSSGDLTGFGGAHGTRK